MRIIGQDEDGRLILDLEGEMFSLIKTIPGDSPVFLTNGVFDGQRISRQTNFVDPDYQRLEVVNPREDYIFCDPMDMVSPTNPTHMIESRFDILDIR